MSFGSPNEVNQSRVLTHMLLSLLNFRNVQTLSFFLAFSSNFGLVVLVNWQFVSFPLTFSL